MGRNRFGLALVVALAASLPLFAFAAPEAPAPVEQAIGDPKAPVRIDEFAMLTCPHCADFSREILPKLKAEYLDTGKARLVFHDVANGAVALRASQMLHCAQSDRFFPLLETIYRTQNQWLQQSDERSIASLRQIFRFAGVADSVIEACLADKANEDAVLKATLDATQTWKLTGTPTVIIDREAAGAIVGTKSYDIYKQAIEARLRK